MSMALSEKPVVFNLLQSTVKGGLEAMFIEYTQILQELGYKVVCLIPPEFQYTHELNDFSATVELFNIKGHYDLLAAKRFQGLCKAYEPTYIFSHNGRTNSLVNLWRTFFKKKSQAQKITTIAVSHGCIKRMKPFDAVIVVSKYLAERLRASGFEGSIFHLPNFLSVDSYPAIEDTQRNIPTLTHQNENPKITLGTLSRISPEKNIGFVVRAVAEIQSNHPELDIQLNIAGDGESKQEVVDLVKQHQLEDKVNLLGWIKDKAEFFDSIDLLVFPSTYEPFGIIILESFYHMTPVIASNAYGPAEIIEHQKDGLLFDVDDIHDFTKKLTYAINHPDLLEKITSNATKKLELTYSKAAAGQKLNEFLRSCSV